MLHASCPVLHTHWAFWTLNSALPSSRDDDIKIHHNVRSVQKYPGFTLIEVVISSLIIATVVGAMFALASLSHRLTLESQDRLVASQLAREGLEVTRQIRDLNYVGNNCASQQCPNWYNGILNTNEPPPVAKQIDTNTQTGFTLSTFNFFGRSCSDYILRDLTTGAITVSHTDPGALSNTQQLFCRRLYIEPVQLKNADDNTATSLNALRIRSQVAWTGYGRNKLLKPGNPTANNVCTNTSAEWCLEQMTILSNWRPAL